MPFHWTRTVLGILNSSTTTIKKLSILVALLGATATAFAESQFGVTGNGRIYYEPDAYDLSFGIVTDDPEIQQCKESHLAAIEKVKGFLDQNKDKVISLKQNASRLETMYRNDPLPKRFLRFTTSYVARVRDAKSLLPFQEGLISSGVTDILGLDLFSEKLPQLIAQARKEAIKDAKTKAELAASELGWVLSGAANIGFQESDSYADRKASVNYGSRGYAYDTAKAPDMTTYVSSLVTITFTFERKK
jgi:uncharacterized protein YggE